MLYSKAKHRKYFDFTRLAHQTAPARFAMGFDAALSHGEALVASMLAERGVVTYVLWRCAVFHHCVSRDTMTLVEIERQEQLTRTGILNELIKRHGFELACGS